MKRKETRSTVRSPADDSAANFSSSGLEADISNALYISSPFNVFTDIMWSPIIETPPQPPGWCFSDGCGNIIK